MITNESQLITGPLSRGRMGDILLSNDKLQAVIQKPGRVMFELAGVSEELARSAMLRAAHKLPIKTKFISRAGGGE